VRTLLLTLLFVACGKAPSAPSHNSALSPTADQSNGTWTGATSTLTVSFTLNGDAFELDVTGGGATRVYTGTSQWDGAVMQLLLAQFTMQGASGTTRDAVVTGPSLCIESLCAPQRSSLSAKLDGSTLDIDFGPLLVGSGESFPMQLQRS
jgi:hypothetical protein